MKNRATAVLSDMGLTVPDVVRIVLTRVAKEKTLPFAPTLNRQAAATLHKSAQGKDIRRAKDADNLFRKLGI